MTKRSFDETVIMKAYYFWKNENMWIWKEKSEKIKWEN